MDESVANRYKLMRRIIRASDRIVVNSHKRIDGDRKDPLVSFIVIAWNADKTISRCLDSILRQEVTKHVILVDNNSTDGTADLAREYPIEVYLEPIRSRGLARNRGLEAAQGLYIAFVDSDVELPEHWTTKAVSFLNKDANVVAVGGPGLGEDVSWVSRAWGELQYGNQPNDAPHYVRSLPTMATLYRGDYIRGLRFRSLWTAEDAEFNFRLAEKGFRFSWSPALFVYHRNATSFDQLAFKSFLYGQWFLAPIWRHPSRITLADLIRMFYVPVLLILVALGYVHPPFFVFLLFWLLLPITAYTYLTLRRGAKTLLTQRLQFVLVHSVKQYAQMLGVWVGLVRGTWRSF